MNKKGLLLTLASCAAVATVAVVGIRTTGNMISNADTGAIDRTIRFDDASPITSAAGTKFDIDPRPGREEYVTCYDTGFICKMDRNGIIFVNDVERNALAEFSHVSSIDICYKAPGTASEVMDIWFGKVSIGDFSRDLADVAYLPGTDGLYSTYTYTVPAGKGDDVIICLYAAADNVEIDWMQINYVC